MIILPGMRGIAGRRPAAGGGAFTGGSYIFNGSNERLQRTFSTSSPELRIMTASLWAAVETYDNLGGPDFFVLNGCTSAGDDSGWAIVDQLGGPGGDPGLSYFDEREFVIDAALASLPTVSAWNHYVLRIDTTQGASANRVRQYKNGTLLTQDDSSAFSNDEVNWFVNGAVHYWGADANPSYADGKLAFIDMVYGASHAPTDFAFDDGGTWTAKTFVGSYGTYGYRLDGTDGFNDVSGNGLNFTGSNMTIGANIDTGDLPPYSF